MRTLALLSQNQYRERYLYLLAFVVTIADTNFGFRSYENSSLRLIYLSVEDLGAEE